MQVSSQESKEPARLKIWLASIAVLVVWIGFFTMGISATSGMILPLLLLACLLVAVLAYLFHLVDKSIKL